MSHRREDAVPARAVERSKRLAAPEFPGLFLTMKMNGETCVMIRKLNKSEHGRTRTLWEMIFTEDSKEFLDYYYTVKTGENEIYVVEENNQIRAMLQLNPFEMAAEDFEGKTNYIVGVATEEAYRGRGFMAKLLKESLLDMHAAGHPFTFLMPAAEAIYKPHGFRFVYEQKRCRIAGKGAGLPEGVYMEKAEEHDCLEIAAFAAAYLKDGYQVYAKRTERYYRMLLAEQKSENGGILLLRKEKKLIGCVHFAEEGDYMEIREPLIADGYKELLGSIVYALTNDAKREIACQAYEPEMLSPQYAVWKEECGKPIIMVRVVNLKSFFGCFRAKEDFETVILVKDELLEENSGLWNVSGQRGAALKAEKQQEDMLMEAAEVSGAEGEEVAAEVLASCLSGYRTQKQAEEEETCSLPEAFEELLAKTELWETVFLNEVV